jgi:hypothetical protein
MVNNLFVIFQLNLYVNRLQATTTVSILQMEGSTSCMHDFSSMFYCSSVHTESYM